MLSEIKQRNPFRHFLVLVLILVSGSPGVYGNPLNYIFLFSILVFWPIFHGKWFFFLSPLWDMLFFGFVFIIITFCHFFVFGIASFPGLFNNLLKLLSFSMVVFFLKGEFKYVYFEILFYLSLIGLFFWVFYLATGMSFDVTSSQDIFNSIIVWNVREGELRNSGPFWEPGAYSGYLMLVPLFFLNEKHFFREHSFKTAVLVLALLSTLSTTGYVAFGIYLVYVGLRSRYWVLVFPVFVLLFCFAFLKLDFLRDKFLTELQRVQTLDGGYHGQRFAVLVFDLHYIFKHPLIGNGFLDVTRYLDHPDVLWGLRSGELVGHGNGLSNFIASMGLITFAVYIFSIIRKNLFVLSRSDLVFYIGMIILLLNGEQFLYYPIFLGLPFLSLKVKNRTNDHISSPINNS
ncbi:hypothetical protein [Geofilum rhodophaeum]|uniref:hypothetical protein n=1 Tax=Geofilum rhodophaeum TaxID=1965019 RepID=UPI000B51F054|nr:hypothetical protein [Geofilum rhodophaeum]